MSSFLLTDKQFDVLYTALELRKNLNDYRHLFYNVCDVKALVESWRELNAKAVAWRYREEAETEFPELKTVMAGSSLQSATLYGLLTCLHYQCSEGVTDTPEYASLSKFYDGFAHILARQLPGYSKGWEIA